MQLGELQGRLQDFRSRGVALVAVSVDSPERSNALARKLGLTFPLLSDPSREAILAYGVEDVENGIAWPSIFLVGSKGTVLWRSLAETYSKRPAAAVVLDAVDRLAKP